MQETGNKNSSSTLSIRFSADGFSFCADGKTKSIKFDKSDSSFRRCCAVSLCEPELWKEYADVTILIDTISATLVPSSIFDETECQDILHFNFPSIDMDSMEVRSDYIDGFDITDIYTIDKELSSFISENFPYAVTEHALTALIRKSLRSSRTNDSKELWINVTEKNLYVSAVQGGTLLMANHYPLSAQDDILFWIGSIYNHYNLSQQSVPLWISGDEKLSEQLSERIAVCNRFTL